MVSPGRITGIVVGALAILGLGVYGPAMLLGPLPEVTVDVDATSAAASEVPPVTLPEGGASALAVVAEDGTGDVVATAGDPAAVPIGGAAKMVTLLVTSAVGSGVATVLRFLVLQRRVPLPRLVTPHERDAARWVPALTAVRSKQTAIGKSSLQY